MSELLPSIRRRVYSSSEESEHRRLLERENVRRPGLLLAGLAALGLGIWAMYYSWPRLEALPANSAYVRSDRRGSHARTIDRPKHP